MIFYPIPDSLPSSGDPHSNLPHECRNPLPNPYPRSGSPPISGQDAKIEKDRCILRMRDLVNYASVHPVELESPSAAELKAKKSISGPFITFSRRGPETAKVNFHYSSSTGSRLTTLDAGPVRCSKRSNSNIGICLPSRPRAYWDDVGSNIRAPGVASKSDP